MFAVIYRWRLKPGTEKHFRDAWWAGTSALRAHCGTSGSRLHRTDDGDFVAYAVWPSRERWQQEWNLPPAGQAAIDVMRECIERPYPPTPLDVVDDLLN